MLEMTNFVFPNLRDKIATMVMMAVGILGFQ